VQPSPDRQDDVQQGTDCAGEASLGGCPANIGGIAIDEHELAGYPPYAIDGCTLVYVSRPPEAGTAGDLVVRDLVDGIETTLATAAELPRRPTLAGPVVAWEATVDGRPVVHLSYAGERRTLKGAFDHAGEPRAESDGIVFTAWLTADPSGDTDVLLYLPATEEIIPIATGPSQQRFADISPTHIALTDFSEDPDGRYDGNNEDLADIFVYDRTTRELVRRAMPGTKEAFPMLPSATALAYLHWNWVDVHPEPKLAGYRLRIGSTTGDVQGDKEIASVVAYAPPYIRPAARYGTVEWVASPSGAYTFWRAAADTSWTPVAVEGLSTVRIYAPAPTQRFTVLATRSTLQDVARLTAVSR